MIKLKFYYEMVTPFFDNARKTIDGFYLYNSNNESCNDGFINNNGVGNNGRYYKYSRLFWKVKITEYKNKFKYNDDLNNENYYIPSCCPLLYTKEGQECLLEKRILLNKNIFTKLQAYDGLMELRKLTKDNQVYDWYSPKKIKQRLLINKGMRLV